MLVTVPFSMMGNFSSASWEAVGVMLKASKCRNQYSLDELVNKQGNLTMMAMYSGLLALFMALVYYLNRPHIDDVSATDAGVLLSVLCKYHEAKVKGNNPNINPKQSTQSDAVGTNSKSGGPNVDNGVKNDSGEGDVDGGDLFKVWWIRGRIILVVMCFSVLCLIIGCLGTANMYYEYFMTNPSQICSFVRYQHYTVGTIVVVSVFGFVMVVSI